MESENENYFDCPNCKKYGKHVKISFTEWATYKEEGVAKGIAAVCGILGDLIPLNKLVMNYWKCCNCGHKYSRWISGDIYV